MSGWENDRAIGRVLVLILQPPWTTLRLSAALMQYWRRQGLSILLTVVKCSLILTFNGRLSQSHRIVDVIPLLCSRAMTSRRWHTVTHLLQLLPP